MPATADPLATLRDRLSGVKGNGQSFSARCPAHDDRRQSLSVSRGNGEKVLLHCHAGCETRDIVEAVGLTIADLFPNDGKRRNDNTDGPWTWADTGTLAATYRYVDENGELLFEKLRSTSKDFAQRRPDKSKRNGWTYKLGDVRRVLYRLPDVLKAVESGEIIYVCEGEKDCDRFAKLGLCATTNPEGAGRWRAEYTKTLAEAKHVIILPDADEPGRQHAWHVANELENAVVLELPDLPDKGDVSDWLAAGGTRDELVTLAEQALENPPEPPKDATPPPKVPKKPLPLARSFLKSRYTDGDDLLLRRYRGEWFTFDDVYRRISDEALGAEIYRHLETLRTLDDKLIAPGKTLVNEVLGALPACDTLLSDHRHAPFWIDGREDPDPARLAVCENGLLDLIDCELHATNPALFSTASIGTSYDPDAAKPEAWLGFLNDLFGEDHEAIQALKEWFGYCLTPDTSQQKAMLIVGPKRSGKGTIGRALQALLGPGATCSPTLSSLNTNFGLAPLIDKRLAILADARLSNRTDQAPITERILSITGEDSVTIDRKHMPHWTGRLPTRFMVLTNELPVLNDSSGAFASRFIILQLTQSFYGREDTTLEDRSEAELPGILNWALSGLDHMLERGRFVQPESSNEVVRELEALSSPVSAFVAECCEIDPEASVPTDVVFQAWKEWCERNGNVNPSSAAIFGRNLRATLSLVKRARTRGFSGERVYVYTGIRLK